MDFHELMVEFGRACGVGELPVDDDGCARIDADDTRLAFIDVPTERKLVISAEIAEKPQGNLERLYEVLLEAQHLGAVTGGATFSLSPSGWIVLHRIESLEDLDVQKLAHIVEDFLNLVVKWREAIDEFRPDETVRSTSVSEISGDSPEPYAIQV